MGIKRNQYLSRCKMEALETRTLFSVVNVTPGNFAAAIAGSNAGDTMNFAPGTYTLQTNSSGAAAIWPANRVYQGNGTTLTLSGGQDRSTKEVLVKIAGSPATTEFTGFTCTDAPMDFENGVFDVHGNTFENTELGVFVSGNSGHIDGNTFTGSLGQGIYGYPGDNGTFNNNTIGSTTGDDGIHLVASAGNNTTVSGNVVTGCTRIGIEIQLSGSNISITNNYAALIQPPTGSYMAFSIACGNANNVTVTGNTGVSNVANTGACVEIMGYNATVSNNTSWGFAQCILNGAQGSSVQARGNNVYGGSLAGNDRVPWPIAPIVGNNAVMSLAAMPVSPNPSSVNNAAGAFPAPSTVAAGSNPIITRKPKAAPTGKTAVIPAAPVTIHSVMFG